ncbi:hypothetical protein RB595_003033 [Gaeumannomyces hyphopodioides]
MHQRQASSQTSTSLTELSTFPVNRKMASPEPSLRAQLDRDGFVVLRQVLDGPTLQVLREAAANATALARAGKWKHIRTVGKQFPPWPETPDADAGGIWGVQALLHPDMPGRDAFARVYFSDAVLGPARELMRDPTTPAVTDDDLVMELFNMLVTPGRAFELRWHRDDVPADATDGQELARLSAPAHHVQYNLALHDDDSLVCVPGSHVRARTPAERAAGPYEVGLAGETRVRLGAGDAVFYDNNMLHRGVYDPGRERATLHGSVGHAGGDRVRARNVLQHGVGAWVGRCGFEALADGPQRRRAEAMRDRLVRLGRDSGDVGFSLEG